MAAAIFICPGVAINVNYKGYQLDVEEYSLTDRQKKLLDACIWLVDNRKSIRVSASNMLVSKSTLGRFLKDGELAELSYDLYGVVRAQIKKNIHKLNRRKH